MRDVLELTDQQLIAAARGGDDGAFEQIVKRYEPVVAATVMGMLGRREEAEDVGQETFIQLYKSLGRFRGEASLKTYITRIAMNLSLNELKRRSRNRKRIVGKPVEEFFNLEARSERAERRDNRDMVRWAIEQLDEKFRSVIVLRLIDGYSTDETAKILDIPVGTALSRLARAQEKLRTILTALTAEEWG